MEFEGLCYWNNPNHLFVVLCVSIGYPLQFDNHAKSFQLEEQTLQRITSKIQDKVMKNKGTWIDWQYLLDATTLLKKVHDCPPL